LPRQQEPATRGSSSSRVTAPTPRGLPKAGVGVKAQAARPQQHTTRAPLVEVVPRPSPRPPSRDKLRGQDWLDAFLPKKVFRGLPSRLAEEEGRRFRQLSGRPEPPTGIDEAEGSQASAWLCGDSLGPAFADAVATQLEPELSAEGCPLHSYTIPPPPSPLEDGRRRRRRDQPRENTVAWAPFGSSTFGGSFGCSCCGDDGTRLDNNSSLVAMAQDADDLPSPSEWSKVGDEALQVRHAPYHPCVIQLARDPEKERQEIARSVPPLLQPRARDLFQQLDASGPFARRGLPRGAERTAASARRCQTPLLVEPLVA